MEARRETEPWRGLPASVAAVIEPALDASTQEILDSIAREVPEYARPLEGSFGRGLRTGVSEALRQFAALIRDPDADRTQGREVYRGLGRGELRQGRTLDSLQAAYRVGARVAWRRVAETANEAGLDPAVISLLAESVFAYIDQLSSDSVEGYAEAFAAREDERQRRHRALAELLIREPPVDETVAKAAATEAGWAWPRRVAALACTEEDLERLRGRLRNDSLVLTMDGLACVVIPDPQGPGRARELESAAAGTLSGPPGELPASWRLARGTLNARDSAEPGLARAEDHLAELMLGSAEPVLAAIGRKRLASLDDLSAGARVRMEETALAYVQHAGNAAAMGRALALHPQTIRHRLRGLRELLGEQLDDPDARFELEAALRARRRQPQFSR
jgi:hypothetical protein